MDKSEAAEAIKRIIRMELGDCERAIKSNNLSKAESELEVASAKLKRIATALQVT